MTQPEIEYANPDEFPEGDDKDYPDTDAVID